MERIIYAGATPSLHNYKLFSCAKAGPEGVMPAAIDQRNASLDLEILPSFLEFVADSLSYAIYVYTATSKRSNRRIR